MNGVRECLLDRRLQLFGHPKRMEENGLSSTCRTLKICSSFLREWPKNIEGGNQKGSERQES